MEAEKAVYPMYQTETALIVYGDIAKLTVYSLSEMCLHSLPYPRLVETNRLNKGIYIVQIEGKDGRKANQKFVLK